MHGVLTCSLFLFIPIEILIDVVFCRTLLTSGKKCVSWYLTETQYCRQR